jgi:glutathione S-transferase
MQLIGMLDSPYVRRVAISLQLMGIPFVHQSISVFRGFAQFVRINPVVKAPTLVCDDGGVLMDSQLILQYAEAQAGVKRSLMATSGPELQRALRAIGLALAAADKAVQIYYERIIRPADKTHPPWVERQTAQMRAAFAGLETEMQRHPSTVTSATIDQAGVTAAVIWHFTLQVLPDVVLPSDFPTLQQHSLAAEALPEFIAAPHGEGVYRASR